jgi:Fe-S-cluster containining protein
MSNNDILTDDQKSELCRKCRYCCEYVFLPLAEGIDYIRFYRDVRGMDVKFNKFRPWLILHDPCQHLTDKGCKIYKDRPDACKYFDGRKMIFYSDKCLWKKGVKDDKLAT